MPIETLAALRDAIGRACTWYSRPSWRAGGTMRLLHLGHDHEYRSRGAKCAAPSSRQNNGTGRSAA